MSMARDIDSICARLAELVQKARPLGVLLQIPKGTQAGIRPVTRHEPVDALQISMPTPQRRPQSTREDFWQKRLCCHIELD